MRRLLFLFTLLLIAVPATAAPKAKPVTVFAAASLTDVLPQIAEAYRGSGGGLVTFSFDASSRLAPQIEQGAPADLFISADEDWMDYLADKKLLVANTRVDLLGNTLACVVPPNASWIPSGPAALDDTRLKHMALAGETVPAGKYAEAALKHAGVWDALQPRVVRGSNVRAALAYVTGGEAEAGVVYFTDAKASTSKLAFTFDANSHPPIRYPVAVVRRSKHQGEARKFLEYLQGTEARAFFEAAGFEVLAGE